MKDLVPIGVLVDLEFLDVISIMIRMKLNIYRVHDTKLIFLILKRPSKNSIKNPPIEAHYSISHRIAPHNNKNIYFRFHTGSQSCNRMKKTGPTHRSDISRRKTLFSGSGAENKRQFTIAKSIRAKVLRSEAGNTSFSLENKFFPPFCLR